MTLGQHIQELRKAAGLSQEGLGEHLGVSRQAVSKWESDITIPEVDTLVTMSRLFGVTVGGLLQVEEPAGTVSGELTDRELAAIETIVRRYVEEMESRRPEEPPATPPAHSRRWMGALAVLACALTAAILLSVSLAGRLDSMNNTIRYLQNQLESLDTNVNHQINGITDQVTEILESQASLTVESGVEIALIDIEANTVTLNARVVPKTWQEGTAVTFIVDCHGEVFSVPGTVGAGLAFSAVLTFPLAREGGTAEPVTVDAAFTVDGVTQTQRLWEMNYLYEDTFPLVELAGGCLYFTLAGEELPEDGQFTFKRNQLYLDAFSVQLFDGIPFAGPVPEVVELRVGLFRNRTLVKWFEMFDRDEANLSAIPEMSDGQSFYVLPETTLSVAVGDELAVAAVVTDNYGRTQIIIDDIMLAAESGFSQPDTYSSYYDPAEWIYTNS